ncbi:MAG: U32 family peptidase [Venatoribacter sp.]
MKFSLGAIQYYWPKDVVEKFYREVADSDIDMVYMGETVCSKRQELKLEDYIKVAHELREAGKQVCLSTMVLLEAPALVREMTRYVDNGEFMIEANDMGAIQLAQERNLPFVIGSAINVYNQHTLRHLVNMGAKRWVMPVELSREWLNELLEQDAIRAVRNLFDVEVFAFGHMPLAWSARCFTARNENRQKDDCRLACINDPKGRIVKSQDGTQIFVINGIQTQSGHRYNLVNDMPSMNGLVDVVRLSPEPEGTLKWFEAFRANLNGSQPQPLCDTDTNGYWRKLPGMLKEA